MIIALSVCLSVLTGYSKQSWMDFKEIVLVDNDSIWD